MELRQLRYLLVIAEERSFTRAAERLFLTQPALSQQIAKLEEELDSVLLERAARNLRLTAAGELLCGHARRILAEVDSAQVALSELKGLQRGTLRVGTVQTVNAYLMPHIVTAFASAYPRVGLQIEELAADDIEHGLQTGHLQIGIGFVPTLNADIAAEALFEEELVLITNAEHPLAAQQSVPLCQVADHALAMLPKTFCTRRLWEAAAAQAGVQPRIALEMNTISALLAIVRQTHMATVLPALALADASCADLHQVRLTTPTPTRKVGLLTLCDGYQCHATRAFAGVVRQVVNASAVLRTALITA
jgi:LysR family cyn operon transcriptional activator